MDYLAEWPEEMFELLSLTTRQTKFDFAITSEIISQYCKERSHLISWVGKITEESCRKKFSFLISNAEKQKQTTITPSLPPPPPPPPTPSLTTNLLNNTINNDNLSFDDMMDLIARQEVENMKRKEATFNRVLSSLGCAPSSEMLTASPEFSMIQQIVEENRIKKELELARKEKAAKEQEERISLENDREMLRRRFEIDSVDSEGIDPLPLNPLAYEVPDFLLEANKDNSTNNFNINDILLSNELENLLEELEQELDARALEKNDGFEDSTSELGDVLLYLDSVASETSKSVRKVSAPTRQIRSDNNIDEIFDIFESQVETIDAGFEKISLIDSSAGKDSFKAAYILKNLSSHVINDVTNNVEKKKELNQDLLIETKVENKGYTRDARSVTTYSEHIKSDSNDLDDDFSDDDWEEMRKQRKSSAKILNTDSSMKFANVWGAHGSSTKNVEVTNFNDEEDLKEKILEKIQEININKVDTISVDVEVETLNNITSNETPTIVASNMTAVTTGSLLSGSSRRERKKKELSFNKLGISSEC